MATENSMWKNTTAITDSNRLNSTTKRTIGTEEVLLE
jgi:hypothetical protein